MTRPDPALRRGRRVVTGHTGFDALATAMGVPVGWDEQPGGPREMRSLSLAPGLAASALGWRSRIDAPDAIRLSAEWYSAWRDGQDMERVTRDQVRAFMEAQP